jgi:uncharacterized protein
MTGPIDHFLDALMKWAVEERGILAVAAVGSHARRTARPDSDVDVIVIVDDPAKYLKTSTAWIERFGPVLSVSDEDWGLVQSKRVQYADRTEVEFGFTIRRWASINPVDPGTMEVVSDGIRVLYDRETLLKSLLMKLELP